MCKVNAIHNKYPPPLPMKKNPTKIQLYQTKSII